MVPRCLRVWCQEACGFTNTTVSAMVYHKLYLCNVSLSVITCYVSLFSRAVRLAPG